MPVREYVEPLLLLFAFPNQESKRRDSERASEIRNSNISRLDSTYTCRGMSDKSLDTFHLNNGLPKGIEPHR